MNKNGKKALVIILLIILIGIVIWFVYKKVTSNNTNLVPTNETLSQDSIIGNDILQNAVDEANEIEENTVTNEVSDGKVEEEKEPEEEKEESSSNNSSGSEVVSGTETSREERAIELTKEYYADEYGSTDGIYFRCDSVNSDGRYRVIASANAATVGFFYVDINNGKVEEK